MTEHGKPEAPTESDLLFSPHPDPNGPADGGAPPMLDERNTDSVLFNLNQLKTQPSGGSGPDNALLRVARPVGHADQASSGLIDLKALMKPNPPSERGGEGAAHSSTPAVSAPQTTGSTPTAPVGSPNGLLRPGMPPGSASTSASTSTPVSPTPRDAGPHPSGSNPASDASAMLPPPAPAGRVPLIILSILAGLALLAAALAVATRG